MNPGMRLEVRSTKGELRVMDYELWEGDRGFAEL